MRCQHGLFGGNVDLAVRIEGVEVAQGDAGLRREVFRPDAIDSGLRQARVKKVNQNLHA